jgi:glycerol-3-phosphate dehydrogenase (NAD(P)+)
VGRFTNRHFRIYLSNDITGVEVCGVVKNVLAIAAGIVDGLQLGANALSALVTRGLVEMQRLGVALGGQPATFTGLAGLGDLVLSCTDNQSRNRRFGRAIASGKNVEQATQEIGQAIEGYYNIQAVHDLAQQLKIEMPITEQVYQVVYEHKPPQAAMQALLERQPKQEG